EVRERAILAIGLLGPLGKSAKGALLTYCENESDGVRTAAYDVLDKIGPTDPHDLVRMLKNPNLSVVLDAAKALGRIERPLPRDMMPRFIETLKMPFDPKDTEIVFQIRLEVANILGRYGRDAAPAVPALISI